jgi:hypothetical protein
MVMMMRATIRMSLASMAGQITSAADDNARLFAAAHVP